jgi:hypothetical protein
LDYTNPTKGVGLVQSGPHYHLIEIYLVLAMILLKNCSVGVKQQSPTHSVIDQIASCDFKTEHCVYI